MSKTASKNKIASDILLAQSDGFFKRGANFNSVGNIPFGHPNLDFLVQYGESPEGLDFSMIDGYDPAKLLGMPRGKQLEIFGWEGAGKSSLAYRLCGSAQRLGFEVAWIDTENSYSEALAKINGMDPTKCYYANMSDHKKRKDSDPSKVRIFAAEDVFDNIFRAIVNNVKVVVVDSVANLVPRCVLEGTADSAQVAKLARLMSAQLGKIVQLAADKQAIVIWINQKRVQPGVMFGNPETTTGGKALGFNASLRLEIHKATKKVKRGKSSLDSGIYIEDEHGRSLLIGRWTRVSIIKNKFAPPSDNNQVYIPIYYRPYFPTRESLVIDFAKQVKIIKMNKQGNYVWGKEKYGTKKDFVDALKKDADLLMKLVEECTTEAEEQGTLTPTEFSNLRAERKYKVVVSPKVKAESPDAEISDDEGDDQFETTNDSDEEDAEESATDEAILKEQDDIPEVEDDDTEDSQDEGSAQGS